MARYKYRDRFQRKAHEQGLPSRAAFKIEELIDRFKLVRTGDRVFDLGCAPGGWLAIIAGAVGERGKVVGLDIAVCNWQAPNVRTLAGDIREPEVRRSAIEALGSVADVIISDLSPKLSGIAERDQAQSLELIGAALELAHAALKPNGKMAAKAFMNASFAEIRSMFARDFAKVEVVHTKASRPGSAELYIVAHGFHPAAGVVS
jgi:23S rRNA (uridine2552-2'-O)-methyltransferase